MNSHSLFLRGSEASSRRLEGSLDFLIPPASLITWGRELSRRRSRASTRSASTSDAARRIRTCSARADSPAASRPGRTAS